MENEIFRKKSLEKIKSPEDLNDYVHVTNPGVWLLLAAAIVLLAGAVIWGIFGHIETSLDADILVKGGEILCYVDSADISAVEEGMTVVCGDVSGTVSDTRVSPDYVLVDIKLPDGHYSAKIVLEDIRPVSFILN